MAILLRDQSECPICGDVIAVGDDAFSFPAFIINEKDPLFFFSDNSFHSNCLHTHVDGERAIERVEERFRKSGPGKRQCRVCGQEVTDPDDYFLIHHLTADEDHPLFGYNYTHLHISCLKQWDDRTKVATLLEQLRRSGTWSGTYLEELLATLREK